VTNNVNVVNRGFEYIAQYLSGTVSSSGWTYPTSIGWGTANGYNASSTLLPASAPTNTQGTGQWFDVGPYSESTEARVAGTATVTGNSIGAGTVTTQVVGTITSGSGQSIGESFLAFSTTKHNENAMFTAVTTGASAFTVKSAWPAISVPFYVQMNNEVITVSATATTTTATSITRGVNGSAAQTAASNDGISIGNIPGAGASNPNHGDLFAHAGFTALALNSGDSIQFTWQIGITS
jgi:hypothetical protein